MKAYLGHGDILSIIVANIMEPYVPYTVLNALHVPVLWGMHHHYPPSYRWENWGHRL